jgi:FixJ family two-component response regulator
MQRLISHKNNNERFAIMTAALGHVYLVDDDPSIRRALKGSLTELGYTVNEYASSEEFLSDAVPTSPAVVLLDMRMPAQSGIEAQAALLKHGWQTPVIFISGESLAPQIVTAMKQGAIDFLFKPFSMQDLLQAIQRGMALDRQLHAQLIRLTTAKRGLALLTPRETEVCVEMLSGRSNKEIAKLNGSAAATIKLHRSRVLAKMQVKSLSELIALCDGINLNARDPLAPQRND